MCMILIVCNACVICRFHDVLNGTKSSTAAQKASDSATVVDSTEQKESIVDSKASHTDSVSMDSMTAESSTIEPFNSNNDELNQYDMLLALRSIYDSLIQSKHQQYISASTYDSTNAHDHYDAHVSNMSIPYTASSHENSTVDAIGHTDDNNESNHRHNTLMTDDINKTIAESTTEQTKSSVNVDTPTGTLIISRTYTVFNQLVIFVCISIFVSLAYLLYMYLCFCYVSLCPQVPMMVQ